MDLVFGLETHLKLLILLRMHCLRSPDALLFFHLSLEINIDEQKNLLIKIMRKIVGSTTWDSDVLRCLKESGALCLIIIEYKLVCAWYSGTQFILIRTSFIYSHFYFTLHLLITNNISLHFYSSKNFNWKICPVLFFLLIFFWYISYMTVESWSFGCLGNVL